MKRLLKFFAILVGLALLTAVAFGAGLYVGNANLFTPAIIRTASEPTQFNVFWQAWNLVQQNFVDRPALDPTQLTYGAIRGMVQALGDTGHTTFLTPDENAARGRGITGKFSGIGAELGQNNGLPIIVAPLDGSPAQKAGVKAGDIILKVDGVDVSGLSLSEIGDKIRGPAGSEVLLTLFRQADKQSHEIKITRGEITIPAVSWVMIPGTHVALLRLSQFSEQANDALVNALSAARSAGATALLVDVRNNPGGLLDQAVKVTSQFLRDGNVLLEADAQDNRTAFPVQPAGHATDLPLMVLVNPGTASAAEIFAGAIQDHQRGQVVGETTFGTGTVLKPFALADGSELLIGVRQWLTPNGRLIRKQGIKPDVEVKLPLGADLLSPAVIKGLTLTEIAASKDLQLTKALALLGALP